MTPDEHEQPAGIDWAAWFINETVGLFLTSWHVWDAREDRRALIRHKVNGRKLYLANARLRSGIMRFTVKVMAWLLIAWLWRQRKRLECWPTRYVGWAVTCMMIVLNFETVFHIADRAVLRDSHLRRDSERGEQHP